MGLWVGDGINMVTVLGVYRLSLVVTTRVVYCGWDSWLLYICINKTAKAT